jgi:hypothetical protein
MLNQQMEKLKNLQQIKKNEKYNEIEKFVDKDGLRESVINPIKISKPPIDKLKNDYQIVEKTHAPQIFEFWKSRTNQPYKNILKNENYQKIPLVGAKKEDLIIHKVTAADKIGLLADELHEITEFIKTHDDELKNTYSISEETKYKEKFMYNNAYKFRAKFDPSDFSKLKKDRIHHFQKEQKKSEHNKKKVDDLIEAILINGSLTENEIKELETNDDTKNEDIEDIKKELKQELGKDYDENLIVELLEKKINDTKDVPKNMSSDSSDDSDSSNDNSDDNSVDNSVDNSIDNSIDNSSGSKKSETEPIKKITVKVKSKTNIETIDVKPKMDNNILDKYKARQKKV